MNLKPFKVIALFLILTLLPSLLYVFAEASSMAVGILIFSVIAILASKKTLSVYIYKARLFYLILFLLMTHLFYFYLSDTNEFGLKQVYSIILFGLIFIAAFFFSREIKKLKQEHLALILKILSCIFIIIGYCSIFFHVELLRYGNFAKNIFPFAEPSHYAITISGIFLAAGFYYSSKMKYLLLGSVLFFAIVYPSMILLLLFLMMTFIYCFKDVKKIIVVILFILFLYPLFSALPLESTLYFTDRLSFRETNNLTALVFLQGWDDSYQALSNTHGLGLGFQNMGVSEPGLFGERILQIAGKHKNRNDGGFLVAKIISEFGLIGLFFVVVFVFNLVRSVFFVMKFSKSSLKYFKYSSQDIPVFMILGHSLIICFFIEMFARGYGYFSPGVFMAVLGLFLTRQRKTTKIFVCTENFEHEEIVQLPPIAN